jgi:hypothetical protein
MSNPPVTVNLLPSEAYREATGSLVYRLSELMFGSLLAAYCLGFVGAIAATQGSLPSEYRPLGIGLLATQYICISIMFTYLTTSFYLTYHVGILTLPKLPFDRLGLDFTIAVLQAIFFGLSLLLPALFPVLLAVNVFISGGRKNEEYERLVADLFKNCPKEGRDKSKDLSRFRDALAEHLRGKPHLSVWAPIEPDIRKKGLWAFIVGVIVVGLYWASDYIAPQNFLLSLLEWLKGRVPLFLIEWVAQPLLTPWGLKQLLITVEVLLATFFVYGHAREALGNRASFCGFPIKSLDFCKYPAAAKVEDLCRYQADAAIGDLTKTRDEKQPLSNSGESQEGGGDVQGCLQTNNAHPMDKEFENLPSEIKELCKKLFAKS